MKNLLILALDGVMDSSLAITLDTLRAARGFHGRSGLDWSPSHVRHVDATVIAAERWIDAHLGSPITITGLASAVAVSPKTLSRRIFGATGLSPMRFLQRRRVLEAVHLIETTTLTVDAIAAQVGYQDATALRKIIKRELGATPSMLRG